MRRPTPRRTGWRVKLAWIITLLLPGLVCQGLLVLAAGDELGSPKIDIGRRYKLNISGNAYVKCNDSGCGGSRLHGITINDLELAVTLRFIPMDASRHAYQFHVRSGNHEFVPPLSGRLTLLNLDWTEQAKQTVRSGAGGRCDDLSFESIVPESFTLKWLEGPS